MAIYPATSHSSELLPPLPNASEYLQVLRRMHAYRYVCMYVVMFICITPACPSDPVDAESGYRKVAVSVAFTVQMKVLFLCLLMFRVFAFGVLACVILLCLQMWQWQDDNQLWRDYDQDAQLVIEVCAASLEFFWVLLHSACSVCWTTADCTLHVWNFSLLTLPVKALFP